MCWLRGARNEGISMTDTAPEAGAPQTSLSPQEITSPPGSLALDLINTEVLDRGKKRDLLLSPDALARWWEEARARAPDECAVEGARAASAWTSELFEAVKALRAALRILLTHVIEQHAIGQEDLQPVNDILALGYPALERTELGHVKAVMRLRNPEQGSILLPIAVSALRLFTERDWQRLHQCKSDRCVIFFYDATKSGTRRWCSPGCMNRARSIQHYRRNKRKPSLS